MFVRVFTFSRTTLLAQAKTQRALAYLVTFTVQRQNLSPSLEAMIWVCWMRSFLNDFRAHQAASSGHQDPSAAASKQHENNSPPNGRRRKKRAAATSGSASARVPKTRARKDMFDEAPQGAFVRSASLADRLAGGGAVAADGDDLGGRRRPPFVPASTGARSKGPAQTRQTTPSATANCGWRRQGRSVSPRRKQPQHPRPQPQQQPGRTVSKQRTSLFINPNSQTILVVSETTTTTTTRLIGAPPNSCDSRRILAKSFALQSARSHSVCRFFCVLVLPIQVTFFMTLLRSLQLLRVISEVLRALSEHPDL